VGGTVQAQTQDKLLCIRKGKLSKNSPVFDNLGSVCMTEYGQLPSKLKGHIMKGESTAVIESAPEGGYWAICPEVPGANGQGETIEEAKESLKQASFLYLKIGWRMFDGVYPMMQFRKILLSNEEKTIRKKTKDSRLLFEKRRFVTFTLDQSKNGSFGSDPTSY
jgi:predicted RNase H-like HicB family nuclease